MNLGEIKWISRTVPNFLQKKTKKMQEIVEEKLA